jgi:hypothetical protein
VIADLQREASTTIYDVWDTAVRMGCASKWVRDMFEDRWGRPT